LTIVVIVAMVVVEEWDRLHLIQLQSEFILKIEQPNSVSSCKIQVGRASTLTLKLHLLAVVAAVLMKQRR